MQLYHFSEDNKIDIFYPRVKANRKNMPPVVWAIEASMAYTFYCPRNCPRIAYSRSDEVSLEDERRFFGDSASDKVITFETSWYERLRDAVLYRYELPTPTFERFDAIAGYFISLETVVPTRVEELRNPLKRLMDLKIDVRFTPDLSPLRNALPGSTVTHFGIHRFEFAGQGGAS